MFTGIVEELGEVVAVERGAESARVTFRGPLVAADAVHGASIAVNGVCLTATEVDGDNVTVDVMAETLRRSSLATAAPGERVNLERALAADGRFGGHVVQGHVDGTATVLHREPGEDWEVVTCSLPAELRRYVVEKGSIAVDGVSLTVSGIEADRFQISLIPTTLELTTLGFRQPGEVVNLEVDILAKQLDSSLAALSAQLDAQLATLVDRRVEQLVAERIDQLVSARVEALLDERLGARLDQRLDAAPDRRDAPLTATGPERSA